MGSYLGGVVPRQIVVDSAGYAYILGWHTEHGSIGIVTGDAPITQNAVQTSPNSIPLDNGVTVTPTLMKLTPDGQIVYTTFLGGIASMAGGALAVDDSGSAVVCGSTADPRMATPTAFQRLPRDNYDVFVARLNPSGTAYDAFTYLGGAGIDRCAGVQLAPDGGVYLFGDTNSRFFPVTAGAYQTGRGAGWSLFAAKLDRPLQRLSWSTYISSNWDCMAEQRLGGLPVGAQMLAMTAGGNLAFVASVEGGDFPVSPDTAPPPVSSTPGLSGRSVFAVLEASGSKLLYSHPLPMAGTIYSIATGDGNSFYLTGNATIGDLVLAATLNAQGMEGLLNLGSIYSFPYVAQINLGAGSLAYLGPLREIEGLNSLPAIGSAVAPDGTLVLASIPVNGFTSSVAPVRSLNGSIVGGYGTVVFGLDFSGQKEPLVTAVVNPATLLPSPISPGQVLEIRGEGLGPPSGATADLANLPRELAGTQVRIAGAPVLLLSVRANSILALVPADNSPSGSSSIVVTTPGGQSDSRSVPAAAVSPGVFTTCDCGTGQAVAFNSDSSPNSPRHPASKGTVVRLIATGLGGALNSVSATLEGQPAQVKGVAPADGYPSGYFAVDVLIPYTVPEADFVIVEIAGGGVHSPFGVTVSIR
jgi:uncharacterized protein (TIGR03437 family)